MASITTCSNCAVLYEEVSEEEANNPIAATPRCLGARRKARAAVAFIETQLAGRKK